MLIPAKCFKVSKLSATESTRYAMNGVLVERTADGIARLVATDGRRLGIVTWTEDVGVDFPTVDGASVAHVAGVRTLIPRKEAEALGKLKPQPTALLSNVLLDENVNGKARFATVDGGNLNRTETVPIDGDFPEFSAIVPTGVPTMTLLVNPTYLAEILKTAQDVAGSKDSPVVRLSFFGDGTGPMVVESGEEYGPVKFKGLLMPITGA